MHYKIGFLASLFGVSPQTIRYYEEQGFLVPEREQSTTRLYQSRNLKWLFSIRRYLAMGFSIKEIKRLFAGEELGQLDAQLQEKAVQTQAALCTLRQQLSALERQQRDIERIKADYLQCRIERDFRQLVLINQQGQFVDTSDACTAEVTRWLSRIENVYSASVLPLAMLCGGQEGAERSSGYCMDEAFAREMGITPGGAVRLVSHEMTVRTVTALSGGRMEIDYLRKYCQAQGYVITGDAVGRCLAKVGENACVSDEIRPRTLYYEYFVPVKKAAL